MLPAHLAAERSTGFHPFEPVAQYELGSLRNFIYLILDWEKRKAAIVDPQADLSGPLSDLTTHGFSLVAALLTHTHPDHIAGVPYLLEQFPTLPVFVHPLDARRLRGNIVRSLREVSDGQELTIGSLVVRVLHTPGHSSGECCYYFEATQKYLFTGDTLFIRDCGRTDFADGSNEQMFESLQRIKKLPPETLILPGHHYAKECASVLSKEILESPPLRCQSVAELAALP